MKFRISATSIWVWDDSKEEEKELLEKYPCLKDFGFDNCHIMLDSLEDLERLRAAVHNDCKDADELIICGSPEDPGIEIYDTYRE